MVCGDFLLVIYQILWSKMCLFKWYMFSEMRLRSAFLLWQWAQCGLESNLLCPMHSDESIEYVYQFQSVHCQVSVGICSSVTTMNSPERFYIFCMACISSAPTQAQIGPWAEYHFICVLAQFYVMNTLYYLIVFSICMLMPCVSFISYKTFYVIFQAKLSFVTLTGSH